MRDYVTDKTQEVINQSQSLNEKVKDTLLYFTKDIAVYLSYRFTGSFL